MQRKIYIVFGVLGLWCTKSTQAQIYTGVEAGINRNYLISNTADKPFFEYQQSTGFSVGMPIRYAFAKSAWISGVQVIPTFVQKNYMIQRTGDYAGIYQQTNNSYLELPVMAQLRIGSTQLNKTTGSSLSGFLNLGGFAGYWLQGHVEGRTNSPMDLINYVSYNTNYTFDSRKDNRFEWGGVLGLGLQYALNKIYTVTLEARYSPSFSDQQKDYQANQSPRYNDTYSLLASIQCNWRALKHKSGKKGK
jgi:hypothetical protein